MTATVAEAEGGLLTAPCSLPDGWRLVRLGDVCAIVMGQSPVGSSYNFKRQGEPLLNGPTEFGAVHPNPVQWTTEPVRFAEPRDILFCVRGATTGRKNIADQRYCIGRGLAAIRGKEGKATTEFLAFVLDYITSKLLLETAGSTFPNLPGEKLEKFEVQLPPLSEQKRIARLLNEQMVAVEGARTAAAAQWKAAKALRAACFRSVFSNSETQRWQTRTLGEICIESGQYGTSERANDTGEGIPVLGMRNLSDGQIVWDQLRFMCLSEKELQKYRLAKGDILFNRTNSAELVGKTAVFDGLREAVFASYLIRFKLNVVLANPYFVSAYINSQNGRGFIEANMTRAIGQVNISASTMHKMPVPLPPITEQERIVARLSEELANAGRVRVALQEQLDVINKLPTALVRRAFIGES